MRWSSPERFSSFALPEDAVTDIEDLSTIAFENSDLIRFAKAPADNSRLLDAANDLAGFIRATIPVGENNGNAKDAEVKS